MNSSPVESAIPVYIAGPDVFNPDHQAVFEHISALCERHGLQAVVPIDNEGEFASTPPSSVSIYEENIRKLRSAKAVLANLRVFRGAEPDAGTCFEVGFAVAMGIPVVSYGCASDYRDKVAHHVPVQQDEATGRLVESDRKWFVEDFGLPHNLMLAHGARHFESIEHAVSHLAEVLGSKQQTR